MSGQARFKNVRLSVSLSTRSYEALRLLSMARARPISVVLRELLEDASHGIAHSAKVYLLAAYGELTADEPAMTDSQSRLRHRELLAELMEISTYTAPMGTSGGRGRRPTTSDNSQCDA